MGQKQTSRHARVMSVLPLKADIRQRIEHVCLVPIADIGICGQLTAAPSRADGNDVASIELR